MNEAIQIAVVLVFAAPTIAALIVVAMLYAVSDNNLDDQ